jgi:hypothetical protein
MFNLFSLEADNDDIDIDVSKSVTINDETAVDEAGSDSEVTDVSDISEKTAAHNEAASAGGVATGNNVEQISMDPVAASESYILRHFGLSREDLEEAVEETIAEAENIPNADVVEDDDSDLADTAVSSGTTVNISSPSDTHIDVNAAGDEVEVGTDGETVVSEEPEAETASDVATLEGLRRMWSLEDDAGEPDSSISNGADVEFDVKTPENDVNIELEGKAVTIEPNGDDTGSEPDYGNEPAPASEEGGENATPDAGEGGEAPNPETTEESLFYWA